MQKLDYIVCTDSHLLTRKSFISIYFFIGDLTEKRSWFKQPVKPSKFYQFI